VQTHADAPGRSYDFSISVLKETMRRVNLRITVFLLALRV
jgi:hypothetical protein